MIEERRKASRSHRESHPHINIVPAAHCRFYMIRSWATCNFRAPGRCSCDVQPLFPFDTMATLRSFWVMTVMDTRNFPNDAMALLSLMSSCRVLYGTSGVEFRGPCANPADLQ